MMMMRMPDTGFAIPPEMETQSIDNNNEMNDNDNELSSNGVDDSSSESGVGASLYDTVILEAVTEDENWNNNTEY